MKAFLFLPLLIAAFLSPILIHADFTEISKNPRLVQNQKIPKAVLPNRFINQDSAVRNLVFPYDSALGSLVDRDQDARAGDPNRDLGDPNRVVNQGKRYEDKLTGNDVIVDGNRVVVINPKTREKITKFKNTRRNTRKRIDEGRWIPKD